MRTPLRLAATAVAFTLAMASAADPPPLLRTVVPPAGAVRVRVPLKEDKATVMQFKALLPKPQGKKGETVEARVHLATISNPPFVYLKAWKKWGYEVPGNRTGVIPELIVPGGQIAPKASKGRDVEVRLADFKVEIIEPTAGAGEPEYDICLGLRDLIRGGENVVEPQLFFADRFLDLSLAGSAVKRLGTGSEKVEDVTATNLKNLVPAAGPMVVRGWPVFSYAAVNGMPVYKAYDNKEHPVNVGVSTSYTLPAPGVVMTVHTADGCGVDYERLTGDWTSAKGKVKELRLGLLTGAGLKAQKDIVLRDVAVVVTNEKSYGFVYLGPRFVEEYFADGVYACGNDGVWRLHGRVKSDLLEDVKTRTPQKKP